ncbi:hypothetical protein BZL41_18020 [Pseudomonas sp. PIC25]|uniref:hypothetical protein n=1 Tax=Pseudomonas sp. PIC25 TaxID=1958773 RepID=UPI000BAB6F6D|nr:hypothetical protein [Pseudomonas sp. PIC25]PAU58413.1 hypothetical protein BZL41_18020 [Pseudomonas sp. PIC25]
MHTPNQTTPGLDGQSRGGTSREALTEELQDKAKQATEEVKVQGKEQLDRYRETAADELDRVAQGARAAASELERQDDAFLSHYVADIAGSLGRLADNLRGKSADTLFREASQLARDNPALFITGSIALGFGLTRFARASGRRDTDERSSGMSGTGTPTSAMGASSGSRPAPGSSGYSSPATPSDNASTFANASCCPPGRGDGKTSNGGTH